MYTPIISEGGEEYQVIHSHQSSHSQLSIMINNALLGNVDSTSSAGTRVVYDVQEQFITIKPDGYNDNVIFEETKKKVDLLNSNVPFLLPVFYFFLNYFVDPFLAKLKKYIDGLLEWYQG